MVVIGWPDSCYAFASLSRFGACPREGHLDLLLHVFGFLKYFPKRRIAIDLNPMDLNLLNNVEKLQADFLHEYQDATEELDPKFPAPRGDEQMITF